MTNIHCIYQRPRRAGLATRFLLALLALSLGVPSYWPARAQAPAPGPAAAPVPAPEPPSGSAGEKLIQLNFKDAPLDQVLEFAAELLGRTLIKSPGLNATITLKSQSRLSIKEGLQAIETVLAMNNVSLVPMGDKFLKVVQIAAARQEGMPILLNLPDKPFAEADQLVSQVVVLKHVEIAEATPIIQSFLHGYGKIQPLERNNSLMITDTAANMKRVLEILDYIDQPVDANAELRIYEIRFAKAADIAGRINELIADSQAKEDKPKVEQVAVQGSVPPAIQALRPGGGSRTEAVENAVALAERGVIRGKVKIVADEPTNILFILSRTENFVFFDRIIEVLDRTETPDLSVRVVALEYAKADEISSILNEFVGAASAEKGTTAPANAAAPTGDAAADSRSQALREFVAKRAEQRTTKSSAGEAGKSGFGSFSEDAKILSDKRTNSLLLMGTKRDIEQMMGVIDGLDIMLAQVLIETVIMEINLGKGIETGVDWLQRSVTAYNTETKGPGGGVAVNTPVMAFGGGSVMNSDPAFRAGNSLKTAGDGNSALSAGALTYYMSFMDLNIDAVIKLAANSRDARLLSTPVVLTTDNTEAKINIGEKRPVVTSTSTTDGGNQNSNYEYQNIGITLTVTPRINPARYVVMEIAQKADNVAGFEVIDGNNVPIITTREINAQIAVNSRNTIVLGGLVSSDKTKSRNKIPFLGDLPLLGAFFRSDTRSEARTELLVLITPYVMMTPGEAREETVRLHAKSQSSQTRWHEGWSDSELPQMTKKEMDEVLKQRETVETGALIRDVFPSKEARTDRKDTKEESAPVQIETLVVPADDEPILEEPAAAEPALSPDMPAPR